MLMVSIIGEDFAALSLAVSMALCDESRERFRFHTQGMHSIDFTRVAVSPIARVNQLGIASIPVFI